MHNTFTVSPATADRPFVTLVGGSVPDENAAQILFGIGSAEQDEAGILERAAGGTLYLRDLDELHPAAQRLLAGALEQGSFVRVGHAETVPMDVRVIASLSPARADKVRPDLLSRLAVLELRVPALRDRREDVSGTAARMCRTAGRAAKACRFAASDWPRRTGCAITPGPATSAN